MLNVVYVKKRKNTLFSCTYVDHINSNLFRLYIALSEEIKIVTIKSALNENSTEIISSNILFIHFISAYMQSRQIYL